MATTTIDMTMKIFHLFSNHKYTGPADPALVLSRELARREVDLTFFPGRSPKGDHALDSVAARAEDLGLPVSKELRLYKHGKPLPTLQDISRLRRLVRRERPDVIHTHLPNDHLIASLAARHEVPIVRTFYDAELPTGWRARAAFANTEAAIVFSAELRESFRSRLPKLDVRRDDPVLDTSRFDEGRSAAVRDNWNAGPDDFVVGVVARMQTHRLFPELIEGFARVARDDPGVRLVVLGRGTNRETVAFQPAAASGVSDQIVFPGYIESDRYPAALPCFDALLFMVPGSDGTCRAAREALASGVPLISTRRGLLRAINEHESTGLFLDDESPAAIAAAVGRLRRDRPLRDRLAETARRRARERFDVRGHVDRLLGLYEQLVRDHAAP